MKYIGSYKHIAHVFGMTPPLPGMQLTEQILFINVRFSDDSQEALLRDVFKTTHLFVDAFMLPLIDSNYAKRVVISLEALKTDECVNHLWRVAREGAEVVIITPPEDVPEPDYKSYGLINPTPGLMSWFPYSIATVRKDAAAAFRK